MTVNELTRGQLIELKQSMLCEWDSTSYEDLARADKIVPDNAVFEQYGGTNFVPEDFFCSAGQNA